MGIGIVKWYDNAKGFGFITPEDGTDDVFLHVSRVTKSAIANPEKGMKMRYSIVTRNGRKYAEDLEILEKPEPMIAKPAKRKIERELDDEELFEREWGLRRAF